MTDRRPRAAAHVRARRRIVKSADDRGARGARAFPIV